jgi:hypothetical protein
VARVTRLAVLVFATVAVLFMVAAVALGAVQP